MKIALIGYGKMGKVIERIAIERGHAVTAIVKRNESIDTAAGADVAIEFTNPDAVYGNLNALLNLKIPVVCGTTGWEHAYQEISNKVIAQKTSFIYASNYSVGVNIMFEMNKKLAQFMTQQSSYNAAITEIHHTEKLDAPSGTAITLAQEIVNTGKSSHWELKNNADNEPDALLINAIRKSDVKGIHHVSYSSEVDKITLSHEAYSRDGFALGAILAAEYINGKQGVFNMRDVLDI